MYSELWTAQTQQMMIEFGNYLLSNYRGETILNDEAKKKVWEEVDLANFASLKYHNELEDVLV
jgi:hypothetical protein